MRRAIDLSNNRIVLLCACVFLQVGICGPACAQDILQNTVITGLSCAPSNNGTGHMICSEELSTPTLGGVSWQVPNVPVNQPPGENGGPIEASGKVAQITPSITLPTGPFTGTPACAPANDGTGSVICAVEGTNNGLYGIAIHPQPLGGTVTAAQATSGLMPLLLPGTVITGKDSISFLPCTPNNPCNRVASIAGKPSCAGTEGSPLGDGMVICGVLALMQNSDGAAVTGLVGIAFNPRAAPAAGSNPAITLLPLGTQFVSDPSCAGDIDPKGQVNGGKGFAVCAIVFDGPVFGATATLFASSFDPRSGYFDSIDFSATGGMDFSSAPSCSDVFDNTGAVICAIGEGDGNGFGTGTSSALLGLEWNPVLQTTATLPLLTPPPGVGFWTGVSCASPNEPFPNNNSVVCVATTSNKEVLAINFDPRTGHSAFTGNKPAFSGNVFSDANGLPANPHLSCITAAIVSNQVACGIVDGAGNSVGFFVPVNF